MAKAYWVTTYRSISNPDALAAYAKLAGPSIAASGGKFLVRGMPVEAWESGMKTAVKVRGTVNDPSDRDDGWTAVMQIPIASLSEVPNVPPKVGDRWRFNAYRLEHLQRRQVEGQAFSPLFIGDFHALPRFGWLAFK